jgi:hypothetical protein
MLLLLLLQLPNVTFMSLLALCAFFSFMPSIVHHTHTLHNPAMAGSPLHRYTRRHIAARSAEHRTHHPGVAHLVEDHRTLRQDLAAK